MPAPVIDLMPDAPLRSDPNNFSLNFETWMLAFNDAPAQYNALSTYLSMLVLAGTAGTFRGDWSAVTTYLQGESVSYNGAIWLSLQGSNLNHAPAEGAWWSDPIGGLAIAPDTVTTFTNKTISVDTNTINGLAATSFVLSDGSGNIDGSAGQKAIPAGVVVGTTDTQTLTAKTISADNNTLSGFAVSSFALTNASGNLDGAAAQKAIPAGVVVGTSDTQTLTAKTINVDNNTISGIAASSFVLSDGSGNIDGAAGQKAIPAGVVVGTTDAQTLTTKTIAFGSNTVSGTKAQFNTACTDDDFVFPNDVQTLTNKTIDPASNTLTGLDPHQTYVATGTIGNAATVALRADGTVEVVSSVVSGIANANYNVNAATFTVLDTCYDPDDNVIIVAWFESGTNTSYACVGVVSGTSIAWGAAFSTGITGTTNKICVAYAGSSKIVVGCRQTGQFNTVVGTISGTSIAFGSAVNAATTGVYNTSSPCCASLSANPATNTVVFHYHTAATTVAARAGTISGTTITFGTEATRGSMGQASSGLAAVFDPVTSKHLSATTLVAAFLTVSGTTITWSGTSLFGSGTVGTGQISVNIMEGGYALVAYQNNSGNGYLIVADLAGATVGYGAPVVFRASPSQWSVAWNFTDNKGVVVYSFASSYFGTAKGFTASGTTITLGSEFTWESDDVTGATATILQIGVQYADDDNEFVCCFKEGVANFVSGTIVNTDPTVTTNADDFIGFAESAVTNGQSVRISGLNQLATNLSGLTPANDYWIEHDGTLVASNTGYSKAGRALSATKMAVGA